MIAELPAIRSMVAWRAARRNYAFDKPGINSLLKVPVGAIAVSSV
jgi:hypothetical protein